MKKLLSCFAAMALLVSLTACSDSNSSGTEDEDPNALKPIPQALSRVQQTPFAQQSNKFANKLFAVLSSQDEYQGKNVCVAPISMQFTLSMLANGADEDMQKEMLNALGFESIDQLNNENLSLLNLLAQDNEYVEVALKNSMWLDNAHAFMPAFKTAAERYYQTDFNVVDFKTNRQGAKQQINQWAKENTNNNITDVPFSLIKDTRLVIANANYFNGKWAYPFNPAETGSKTFYNADGTQNNVMTMSKTLDASVYADDSLQVAELPYGQGYYSMIVAMPRYTECLDSIAENADWWGWHEKATNLLVKLALPRFNTTSSWQAINNVFDKLGMPSANSREFSNICTPLDVQLNDLTQSVTLQVDENGTKAASTTVGRNDIIISDAIPVNFNRPFIFAIRENNTGAILFMGRVIKL